MISTMSLNTPATTLLHTETATTVFMPTTLTAITTPAMSPSPTSSLSSSIPLPYTSAPLPSSTGAANYIFIYGDSYTATGFNINNTKPAVSNPLGNPVYPGSTSTGAGQPNWVDIMTTNSPLNTLTYDFAVGGASVNNSLIQGAHADTPAFLNQSATWLNNIKAKPSYCPWTAANSVHVIWFGRNDVFWQVSQNASMTTRLDAVMTSYMNIVNSLWMAGARQFVVIGMPPMAREPIWSTTTPDLAANNTPSNVFMPRVQASTAYWTANIVPRMQAWKKGKPAVKLGYVDMNSTYSRVLDNYAAWGLYSNSCTNNDSSLPNGTQCAFADSVHPGPPLATSIAIATGQYLKSSGFLSGYALSYTS